MFFGTGTLSFADGVTTQEGDVFEIEAAPFRFRMRNSSAIDPAAGVSVRSL